MTSFVLWICIWLSLLCGQAGTDHCCSGEDHSVLTLCTRIALESISSPLPRLYPLIDTFFRNTPSIPSGVAGPLIDSLWICLGMCRERHHGGL